MALGFLKETTEYSVRKFLAYATGLVFIGSCVVTIINNKGTLDMTQYGIIGATFAFYFGKELFSKLTINSK